MPTTYPHRLPMRLALLLAVSLIAVAVIGCGEDGGSAGGSTRSVVVRGPAGDRLHEPAGEGRFALLALNTATVRQAGVADSLSASAVEVAGQFVAWSGPDDRWALRVLDLWLPEPEANGGLDACRLTLDALEAEVRLSAQDELPDYRIELLDAGGITLARDERSDLQVHYLPDLQAYLSGLIYGLEAGPVPYHAEAAYLFEGDGGYGVEAFDVTIAAPPAMVLVAVDGQPYDSMLELVVPSGRDLALDWAVTGTPGDDVVFLDLYDDARSAAPLLSCTLTDDGHFAVPRAALEQVRQAVPDAALRLVARRARAVEFPLDGFDWARAVFTTSDTVFLVP